MKQFFLLNTSPVYRSIGIRTMGTNNKVLLLFNTEKANGIKRGAQICAEKLNELNRVFPFTSEEEHSEIFSNPRETFNQLMRLDPEVVKLEKYVDIETIKIPTELHEKFRTLGLNKAGGTAIWSNFENVKYDAVSERWVIDEAAVAADIEATCPTYAETPQQLLRLETSKALCKLLNSEGRTHDDTRRKFEGMLRFSGNRSDKTLGVLTDMWVINPEWILGSTDRPIEHQATRWLSEEHDRQCRGIFDF